VPPTTKSRQLGKLVHDRRKERGLPLQAVADAAGTDAAYMYRLERGEYHQPRPEILAGISKALAIPLANLYALAGYPITRELPDFEPYLRAKTKLPEKAIHELQRVFEELQAQYGDSSGPKRGRS
jgi:transcriptional regulator with XRE-family HTH domain